MGQQTSLAYKFLIAFIVEIFIIAFMVPGDFIKKNYAQEKVEYVSTYGEERGGEIIANGIKVYEVIFNESGFRGLMNQLFIASEKSGFDKAFEKIENLKQQRMASAEVVAKIFGTRVASVMEWSKYIGIFFIAMFLSAFLEWRIQKSKYGSPSLAKHQFSKKIHMYLLFMFFSVIVFPAFVPAVIFPVLLFLSLTFFAIHLSSMSKKI